MAAVVIIGGGHGLRIKANRNNQPNNIFLLNSCAQAGTRSASVIKVGLVCLGVHLSRRLKKQLA